MDFVRSYFWIATAKNSSIYLDEKFIDKKVCTYSNFKTGEKFFRVSIFLSIKFLIQIYGWVFSCSNAEVTPYKIHTLGTKEVVVIK